MIYNAIIFNLKGMKMKNLINRLKPYKNYILFFILLIAVSNYFFFDYLPSKRRNKENIVNEFVKLINEKLPSKTDEITTMNNVYYLPSDEIVFEYILESDFEEIDFLLLKENTLYSIKNNNTLSKLYKSMGKNLKFKYFYSNENTNKNFLDEFIIYSKEF